MLRAACFSFAVVGAWNVRLTWSSGQGAAPSAKLSTEPHRDWRRPFGSPIRKQVRARSVFCALTRHPIGDTSKQVDDCSGTGASPQRNVERRFAIEHRLGAVEEFAGIAAVPINIEREDIDIPSRASRSPSLLVKCQVADFLRRSSVALGISRNLNRGSSGATEPASRTRALTGKLLMIALARRRRVFSPLRRCQGVFRQFQWPDSP